VILFEITQNEADPIYQELAIANGLRQYDFLRSIVSASLACQRPFLSEHVLKALNFQAIICLHTNAGEYRPCSVTVGNHNPPDHYRVKALMEDFVNQVNRAWETADMVFLAAYVLWRLNYIHPFINGNGRTARAACYFVLCVKAGRWLPGTTILPELIRRRRPEYVAALQAADLSLAAGTLNLGQIHALLSLLIQEQLNSENPQPGNTDSPNPT
jgi:fido (protein-threonine AMPylation protein)